MKKTIKYSLTAIIALAALLLCAGYYMLGYALKPAELVTRSRDIEGSLKYMAENYPDVSRWIDSLQNVGALHDLYIETTKAGDSMPSTFLPPTAPATRPSSSMVIQTTPSA